MDEPKRETVREKQLRLFGGGRDTARMEYFSDAVFAIALTLLVLDIRVPDGVRDPFRDLWGAIGELWPEFFAYVLSFAIIAINWVFHHRKFRAIVRYDSGLVWINFAYLLFVALVPFPTSLLSEYAPAPAAIVLYAAQVAVLGYLGAVTWWYAHARGLLSEAVDAPLYRFTLISNLATPIVFTLSIALVLLPDPTWVMWSWILAWPISSLVGTLGSRRPAEPTTGTIKE